jgi:uncharacterized membrane protein
MDKLHNQPNYNEPLSADELPFVAPCRQLPTFAAFHWLSLAWRDFRATPGLSLLYGGILAAASYLLTFLSWQLGGAVLLLSLLSGLVFVAPVLALGLYSVSCQLDDGLEPRMAYCMREGKRHLSNEMLFSLVLLVIFLVWVRAGSAVHIFFPMSSSPPLADLLTFYAIGSVIGAIFAAIVFCASAFSLPMMMDRETDAITAVLTSVNAVRKNPVPMMIWAATIALCVALCMLTAYIGMLVLMPLLGYASWHGYRQTIDASMWKQHPKLDASRNSDR